MMGKREAVLKEFTRVERGGNSPTGWSGIPFLDLQALADEVVQLRGELTKIERAVNTLGVVVMDPPDGGDPTTAEKVQNLVDVYRARTDG